MNPLKPRNKSIRLSLPPSRWSVALATCFYAGHLPVVKPNMHLGSFSISLIAPFACWPLIHVLGWQGAALSALASTLLGTAALIDVEEHGQPSDHDARAVVIDEWAGASVTAMALPPLFALFPGNLPMQAAFCLLAGFLFRILDITKPFPANVADKKMHTPFSVMLDDLIAGAYGTLPLLALTHFLR